jgi:hypothetical protein
MTGSTGNDGIMTKVINFFAGPSAGKTTNAMSLAGMLKRDRKDVLYVPEFAMELCVAGRESELDDQLYLLGEQAHRLYMAKNRFEYVVTDGPLFHSMCYARLNLRKFDCRVAFKLEELTMLLVEQYDNVNFFVDRKHRTFRHLGRVHNEEESRALDTDIMVLLEEYKQKFTVISSAEEAYQHLIEHEDYTAIS